MVFGTIPFNRSGTPPLFYGASAADSTTLAPLQIFCGVYWKKSELILSKIPTDCRASHGRTKTERSGGQKGRGLGERNFCPPSLSPLLFSPPQFFVPMKLARRLFLHLNYKFSRHYRFCKFICLTNIYPF